MHATTPNDEIRILRGDQFASPELRADANAVADRIDHLGNASDRAAALGELKRSLGNDVAGTAAFNAVLVAGQTPRYLESSELAAERSGRMHDAFSSAVAAGSIRPTDVGSMVASQAKLGVADSARVSSYIDHLPSNQPHDTFRNEVIDRSVGMARSLAGTSPAAAGQMYAQAANGLADLSPQDRSNAFDRLNGRRLGTLETIANGAVGGYGDRLVAETLHHNSNVPSESFRVDGVAKLLDATSDKIAAAANTGRVDPVAAKTNSELFQGATSYLAASIGSDQDLALGTRDKDTGLRSALSRSLEENSARIIAGSILNKKSDSLSADSIGRFSAYSRFQADAALPGQDPSTIPGAQAALGSLIGKLNHGVMHGGVTVAGEFPGAFSPTAHGVESAASVMGGVLAATSDGIEKSSDIARQRGLQDAATQKGLQTFGSGIAAVAAVSIEVPVVAGGAALTSWALDHADRQGADTSRISSQGASLTTRSKEISDDIDRFAPGSASAFGAGMHPNSLATFSSPPLTSTNPLSSSLSALESHIGERQPAVHQR